MDLEIHSDLLNYLRFIKLCYLPTNTTAKN